MNQNMESESRFLTKSKCVHSLKMKPCVTWAEMTCGDLLQLCRTAVVRRRVWARSWVAKMCWQPVVIQIQLSSPCQRYVHYHKLCFLSFHFQSIERILSQAPSPICSIKVLWSFLYAEIAKYKLFHIIVSMFKCPLLFGQSSGQYTCML